MEDLQLKPVQTGLCGLHSFHKISDVVTKMQATLQKPKLQWTQTWCGFAGNYCYITVSIALGKADYQIKPYVAILTCHNLYFVITQSLLQVSVLQPDRVTYAYYDTWLYSSAMIDLFLSMQDSKPHCQHLYDNNNNNK